MPENNTVAIGDQDIRINPFKAYKATVALELLSEIGNAIPELAQDIANFERGYSEKNAIRIPRASWEAEYAGRTFPETMLNDKDEVVPHPRAGQHVYDPISEQAWAMDGHVTMPTAPTGMETFMTMFPKVYAKAKVYVLDLLAVVVIPDSEFEAWDDEGGEELVTEKIKERRKKLLHEADFDQLAVLGQVAWDVLSKQFEGKAEALRSSIRKASETIGMAEAEETEQTEEETEEDGSESSNGPSEETEETSPSASPDPPTTETTSSTGSPVPTGGSENGSSTVSDSTSSVASTA